LFQTPSSHTYEAIESGRIRIFPIGKRKSLAEWQGTSDWVLEVVSASSERKDYHQLLDGCFRAEIPEYWLIDARGEDIDFRIYRQGKRGYKRVPAKDGWLSSPLLGAAIG